MNGQIRILTHQEEIEVPLTGMVKDGDLIIPFNKEDWELEELEETYILRQK